MCAFLISKVHKCHLSRIKGASGQPISRILSSAEAPGRSSICAVDPGLTEASNLSSLLDLAPDGGYQAARITANAGGLLHHLFTLTAPCGVAVCFLWPLSGRLPRPGVSPASRSLECGLSSISTSETATVQPT